jgi:hypothetical protein
MRDIFLWFDTSWLAEVVRSSTWMFAFIEVVHLLGITLLLGMVSILDLRLMGAGMRQQSVSDVARDTYPWTILGIILAAGSGSVLFVSEAMKLYDSPPFTLKMTLFVLALASTFFFQQKMVAAKDASGGLKLAALLSLFLWFGVGFAGRAIAFF